MSDREKVFDALRCCITEGKCRNCPWEDCKKVGSKRAIVPVTLMLDALNLMKENEVHELTKEEWEQWKNSKNRDPICMIYKQDDTRTPIWVLDPNKVHEPALLMGEIKLFTGKPTFEQCKAVKWE